MKKLGIFVFLFIIGLFSVYAQDLIILNDGSVIESRVMEISPTEIRYKRFDHQDGPTIIIPIDNVLSIRYQNGRVETISGGRQVSPQVALAQEIAAQLGVPTSIQDALNQLPAIRVAGRNLKFFFTGDTWVGNLNNRPFSSGTVSTSVIDGGYILTLRQTHTYIRGRQIATPGLDIHLEFKPGPPVSFRVLSGSEVPEGLAVASADESTKPKKEKIANIRNNWISADFSLGLGYSVGVRYERMLGPHFSLGLNFYYGRLGGFVFDDFLVFEIPLRFYPSGRIFFLGTSFGYGWYNYEEGYAYTSHSALFITPEIGWKFDVGEQGNFFFEIGLQGPFFFGQLKGFTGFPSFLFFSIGYAF